jgi:dienelactone hydrolase
MTLHTLPDAAGTGYGRQIVRLDAGRDGFARALLTAPALLGIADHRHALRWWRDLRIDEAAWGLAAQRAQPTTVAIEDRGERWEVPIAGALGCPLAWNPLRPRVAGLAVRRGRAHPWVADYGERSVRTFEHLRAATSLTGLDRAGASPLCWLDEHRLVLLTACPRHDSRPQKEEPLVYEAAGPGFVSLEPGLDELLAATGAAVSLLHVGHEAARTLTRPLLVRRLHAGPGARRGVLVEHGTSLRADADGCDGSRDRADRHHGLVWTAARLDLRTMPATLLALDDRAAWPPAPRPQPVLPRPGRTPARAREGGGPRLSTAIRMLPSPAGEHPARLAVFGDATGDRAAATLLWIRACRGPLDGGRPVPAPVPDSATSTAILDLPLHWPADATLGLLHEQIVGALQSAVRALDEDRRAGERSRPIVVGGHSFGATLALYALAHVPGLAGAIAHSGCYNRTHTPFGFQYERRRYWDVPDIYTAFSAQSFADRLRAPVLIVHGLEDVNPATHPDQAADLYRAIVATAGTARLVLLPREEHNFRYRETHERLARIHVDWLQRAATARGAGRETAHTAHPGRLPRVVTADGR